MNNPKNMLGGTINPSGIKQPIQLLAIVLGVIVVALITATVYLSPIQIWLGWFSLISSVGITLIVIHNFLSILKKSPWVFHQPGDYGPGEYIGIIKKMNDFAEDASLHSAEASEKSKEIIEKAVHKNALDTKNIDEIIGKIRNEFDATYSNISSESGRQTYFDDVVHFENLVHDCLVNLSIPVEISPRIESLRPDFVVTKKGGKRIPIEVKLYRKNVTDNLSNKLIHQMLNYMQFMNTDESILVISSEVTPAALHIFKEWSGKNKIHIVVGMTEKVLKSQFADILTK